eukprot:10414622-Alexandrium_andersonii.AAC.1
MGDAHHAAWTSAWAMRGSFSQTGQATQTPVTDSWRKFGMLELQALAPYPWHRHRCWLCA